MTPTSPAGWHARATPYTSAAEFTPTKDALVFAVLLNAQAEPDGFTMALFRPDIAVDARGRVLQLHPKDFSTLASLAEEATHLPDSSSFLTAWRIAHDRTSQKIDRLFVRTASGELKQVNVQGWHAEKKKLQSVIGEYEELPPVLQELFGYIQEGRTDYRRGQVDNADVIERVKSLVKT